MAHLKAALAPHGIDEKVVPREGDIVHHQRGNDFVHVELGLEYAGHEAPQRAGDEASDRHGQEHEYRGRVSGEDGGQHHGAGCKGADVELSLGADVPQLHAKGHGAGQAGQDERRGLDQGIGKDAEAAKRSPGDVGIGPERIAADDGEDDAAQDQSHDDGPK